MWSRRSWCCVLGLSSYGSTAGDLLLPLPLICCFSRMLVDSCLVAGGFMSVSSGCHELLLWCCEVRFRLQCPCTGKNVAIVLKSADKAYVILLSIGIASVQLRRQRPQTESATKIQHICYTSLSTFPSRTIIFTPVHSGSEENARIVGWPFTWNDSWKTAIAILHYQLLIKGYHLDKVVCKGTGLRLCGFIHQRDNLVSHIGCNGSEWS